MNYIYYILRNIIYYLREIFKNLPKTLLSSFGIIFLIAFTVFALNLQKTVKDFLEKRIFGKLQINEIKITPINKTSFINFSAGEDEIEEEKIQTISKLDGISKLDKVIRLNAPSSFRAGILGRYLTSDMLISGVDPEFFEGTKLKSKDFKAGEKIPIVIPMFVMDLYNNFASSNGLPKLGEKALKMFDMEMLIGRSSFRKGSLNTNKYKARLFGFTPSITTAGIIVPSSFIKDLCKNKSGELNIAGNCYSCIMLVAKVSDVSKITQISKEIKKLNLDVVSQADIADKTEKATSLLSLTMTAIIAVILCLTVISIFNAFMVVVNNRSYNFAIQRFLGASKLRIVMVILLESVIVGAIFGVVGYYIGIYSIQYLTSNIGNWVPWLKGLIIVYADTKLFLYAIAFSTLVSFVSAMIPAVIASNSSLFDSIKK